MLALGRRAKNKKRLFLAILSISLVFAGLLVFVQSRTFANSTYMTAMITGDNGEVDFSPGISDAVVDFSYKKNGSNGVISKIYDAKITLRNLPEDIEKHLNVTLPIGMYWEDDAKNDNYLLSQLDMSKGTNGIDKTPVSNEPVLGYNYPNSGTRTYYFQRGTSAVTISIKVKADHVLDMGYIEDAIVADLYVGDEKVESAATDVSVPNGVTISGAFYSGGQTIYVNPGAVYQSDQGYYRLVRSAYVAGSGYYDVRRPYKSVILTLTVSNPDVGIRLTGTDTSFALDDSHSNEGIYVITRTMTSINTGELTIPYEFVVPESVEGGDSFTIKLTGKIIIAEPGAEDRELDFRNTQTNTIRVLPNNSAVTIGASSLNPSTVGTAIDTNYNTSVYAQPDVQGELGRFYVNNRGSEASNPLHAKMVFDTDVLGVMNLELGCEPGKVLDKVHIKTVSGVDKEVEVNKTCSVYGYAGQISYVTLGLERFDYIKEVEYDFGSIPAGFQIAHSAHDSLAIAYTGRLLTEETPGVATLELYEIDDPTITTGVATTTTRHVDGAGTLDITNHATRIINAGQALNFAINVKNWAGGTNYDNTVLSPVMYIRQEVRDASGNFLPISNLKVVTDSIRGSKDITNLFGEISYFDTDTARVYVIDGRNVPDGQASLSGTYVGADGRTGESTITVSWSVETPFTTPDQQYKIADMFFVRDPNRTGAITTHYMRGDPFEITGYPNTTIYAATTNYYQIRGWNAISVENAGKHTSSDGWLTWADGVNPITIGVAEGSSADMQVSLSNNSGVDVPGPTTVYLPIPKNGQDWGSLSLNSEPFKFSVALVDAINNPNNSYFTIAYGRNVTPTENGSELESQLDKFTTDTDGWTADDWKDVNCVRIVARDIAANAPGEIDVYNFTYNLKVVDATDVIDGVTNTWRPLYFQQLTNSAGDVFAGWYNGSYVSIKLADGKVSGRLYIDKDEDGHLDNNEDYLKESDWEIDLYDAVSNRLVRSTTTDSNGRYNFIELSVNPNGYYAVIKNKYPIDGDENGKRYLFAIKGEQSEPGSYIADNQAEGSKTSSPAHLTGYIGNISPSKNNREATYNIGLVEYVSGESYTGTLEFNDQSNEFNTRPRNIQLTANASDGTSEMVDLTINRGQTYAIQLPRYNAQGVRVKYALSAPDVTGYDMDLDTSDDGYVNDITYNLKKFTITTNHINDVSDKKIGDTTTEEYFYGQSYETQPVDMPNRVELLSTDGVESGVVYDDITVNYHYRLMRGAVITHHYIEGTTDKLADDDVDDYDAGDEYDTDPLSSDDLADYELVVASVPNNDSGIVDAPEIEVIYYYRKKAVSNPYTRDRIAVYLLITIGSVGAAMILAKNKSRR